MRDGRRGPALHDCRPVPYPACVSSFHLACAVHVGIDVELRHVMQEGTSPRRRKTKSVRRLDDPGGCFDALLHRVQHGGRTPMLDRIDPIKDLEPAHAADPTDDAAACGL